MPKQQPSVSGLETHLGYWLRYASNAVSQAFAQKLSAHDVSVAEWVVLRMLHDGDMAPSELAGRMGLTRGAISKIVDRLETKHLAGRRAAPGSDKRFQALALTSGGRALVPVLAALADRNDAEFFGHLDATTRATIETAMKAIIRRQGAIAVPVE
jgi:DNA-binding MarR family transcriptional regulator